jgi:hypothetical protein
MADEPSNCNRIQPHLPDSLTRLLKDPRAKIRDTAGDTPTTHLFDRMLWWSSVAMFWATLLVLAVALTVAQRPL